MVPGLGEEMADQLQSFINQHKRQVWHQRKGSACIECGVLQITVDSGYCLWCLLKYVQWNLPYHSWHYCYVEVFTVQLQSFITQLKTQLYNTKKVKWMYTVQLLLLLTLVFIVSPRYCCFKNCAGLGENAVNRSLYDSHSWFV